MEYLALIILAFFILLLIHEITHFLIFFIQGTKVLAMGVSIFHIIEGRFGLHFYLSFIFGGFNLIDTSKWTSESVVIEQLKKLKYNHIFTNVICLIITLSLLILILIIPMNRYLVFFIICLGLFNFLLFLNSVFHERGDIRLLQRFKTEETSLLSYICSSEKITGYKNRWLFKKTEAFFYEILEPKEDINEIDLYQLLDYYIDYIMYWGVENDRYLNPLCGELLTTLPFKNYINFKVFIVNLLYDFSPLDEQLERIQNYISIDTRYSKLLNIEIEKAKFERRKFDISNIIKGKYGIIKDCLVTREIIDKMNTKFNGIIYDKKQ